MGYSDWKTLKSDIESGSGGTYTLCPRTELDATDQDPLAAYPHIYLDDSTTLQGLTIQCGSVGSVIDNCVIKGGEYQFKIGGWANNIEMNGITFQESYFCSIHVGYLFKEALSFNDCTWIGNVDQGRGDWGLLNFWNREGGTVTLNRCKFQQNVFSSEGGRLVKVGEGWPRNIVSVHFNECVFEDNQSYRALIFVDSYSEVSFEKCTLIKNEMGAALIYGKFAKVHLGNCLVDQNDVNYAVYLLSANSEDVVNITDSCFTNNRLAGDVVRLGYYPGWRNTRNFGHNNTSTCDIRKSTDWFDLYTETVCYSFTAGSCLREPATTAEPPTPPPTPTTSPPPNPTTTPPPVPPLECFGGTLTTCVRHCLDKCD